MLMQAEYVEVRNDDTEAYLGESGLYEPYTDNIKRLFKSLQSEYGRCVGKVYIDLLDGGARSIGWIFEKRLKYSDSNETYLQQVWVTLHDDEPERTVKYNYHFLN